LLSVILRRPRKARPSKDAAEAATEIGPCPTSEGLVSKSAKADLDAVALRGSTLRVEHLGVTDKGLRKNLRNPVTFRKA
jgi:hypothetical protein